MDQHAGTTLTPKLCANGIDAIEALPALSCVLCDLSGPGAEHQILIQMLRPVCVRRTSGATTDLVELAREHPILPDPASRLSLFL